MPYVLFGQADEAAKIAARTTEQFYQYGLAGVVILVLFLILIGILWVFLRYGVPALIAKWQAEQSWYQGEMTRQQAQGHDREAKIHEDYLKRGKEQAEAFINALDRTEQRNTETLTGFRADVRQEAAEVVSMVKEAFGALHTKLDGICDKLDKKTRP